LDLPWCVALVDEGSSFLLREMRWIFENQRLEDIMWRTPNSILPVGGLAKTKTAKLFFGRAARFWWMLVHRNDRRTSYFFSSEEK
jgi:hypothetical protein